MHLRHCLCAKTNIFKLKQHIFALVSQKAEGAVKRAGLIELPQMQWRVGGFCKCESVQPHWEHATTQQHRQRAREYKPSLPLRVGKEERHSAVNH